MNTGFSLTGWMVIAVVVVFILVIVWVVRSGANDPELLKILSTPINKLTLGHLVVLILLYSLLN